MPANEQGFGTRAVHAGERLYRDGIRPVVTPIYPSVGYTFTSADELDAVLGGEHSGFVYSTRYSNPTVQALEVAIAELEGAAAAKALSSGMAAIHLALLASGVRAGRQVIAAADVYGATYSLLQDVFAQLGVEARFVDVLDVEHIRQLVTQVRPTVLYAETVSNPLLKIADLAKLSGIAHAAGALFLVDNTFCSPYLCNPIGYGADMVIHSATKFLGGHGDVMGGIVATSHELAQELIRLNKLIGSSIGPFEAWLILRGLKTLPLRLKRQCDSALEIAAWLSRHPRVSHVNYPFLSDHPQHELMRELSHGLGGGSVMSFEIRDAGRAEVFAFLEAVKLIQPATSLGDIYSLVLYPAISSHRSLTPAERCALGISDGLVRLSVGIEDAADILADLTQALAAI